MTTADKTQVTSLKEKIKNDDDYAIGALLKLYDYQTMDEKGNEQTIYRNKVGFNANDAEILSSIAEYYHRHKRLTEKQIRFMRHKLIKYSRQLIMLGGVKPTQNNGRNGQAKKIERSAKLCGDEIVIAFPYDADLVAKVKTLSERRFHSEGKTWTAKLCLESVERLIEWKFDLDDALKAWHKNKVESKPTNINKIAGLKMNLYPFQKEGVKFIEGKDGRALIGDEMGLGKTIQALAWLQLHPNVRPAVIIVPASLKLNWQAEAKRWMENPEIEVLNGTKPYLTKGKILVINYDILKVWFDQLSKLKPQAAIIDECHYVKNSKAMRTKVVKMFCKMIPHVICLSGTPIVNRPLEIFNAVNLIDSSLFPSFWKFAQRYCGARHNGWGWDFSGATNTQELHDILAKTIMLRRVKKEVLKELPDKTRSVVPLEINNRKQYDAASKEFIKWLKEVDPEKAKRAEKAKALTKIEILKQLTINGKLKECIDWIDNFLESDEKLIVFATHRKIIDKLCERYGKIAVRIDGSTKQQERFEAVNTFQNNRSIRLFIGNPRAAGVGLTLTAASNVCFIELGWTPGEHDQAEDRAHRIGQDADAVTIWYLIADNTIEQHIIRLIDSKRKVLNSVLDGKDEEVKSILDELIDAYSS